MSYAMFPWPTVAECCGHGDGTTCAQCDGSHHHRWAAGITPYGKAVRCRDCGGRKCDQPDCLSRRHHEDPHVLVAGGFRVVGA